MASLLLGYILISIAILIFAFTFMSAYNLYRNLNSHATALYNNSYSTQEKNITSIATSFTNSLSSMTSTANSLGYTLLEIMILFLFANIGYKIGYFGINIININKSNVLKVEEKRQNK
ncbi:MAG: hypothetical protein QXP35_00130 [Candidatus Micrarchaeaceae archaeon]